MLECLQKPTQVRLRGPSQRCPRSSKKLREKYWQIVSTGSPSFDSRCSRVACERVIREFVEQTWQESHYSPLQPARSRISQIHTGVTEPCYSTTVNKKCTTRRNFLIRWMVPSVLLGATDDSDRFAAINILVIRLEFFLLPCFALHYCYTHDVYFNAKCVVAKLKRSLLRSR